MRGAAAMQQVADWLEKLGLGQYAQRFAENDISFSVLPDLTDQHLKEIGVSLGHRLQLLRAITELTSRESRCHCTVCRSTGHRRASPSHGYVLRPRRFDRKLLGKTVALATGVFTRYKTDGSELATLGGTYLLRKNDSDWKVAVVTVHPTSDVIRGD
jgi:SAM domain (Sterile alpha motif)